MHESKQNQQHDGMQSSSLQSEENGDLGDQRTSQGWSEKRYTGISRTTVVPRRQYNAPVLSLSPSNSSSTSTMMMTPTMYRYAADCQYHHLIPDRCRSHPDDLQWTDRYGNCALHILCQQAKWQRMLLPYAKSLLSAVSAMLKVRSDAAMWPNMATWTPLHFAVSATVGRGHQFSQPSERTRIITAPSSGIEDAEADDIEKDHHKNKGNSSNVKNVNTALILRLIRACPAAVSVTTRPSYNTNSQQTTPFHLACQAGLDYDVLHAMLLINPRLVIHDSYNEQCNLLSKASKTRYFTQEYHSSSSYGEQNNGTSLYRIQYSNRQSKPSNQHHNNPISVLWNSKHSVSKNIQNGEDLERKMALLLEAAHCGIVSPMDRKSSARKTFNNRRRKFSVLHAACNIRCPRDYFTSVLEKNLHSILLQDEDGLCPLHYAARQRPAPVDKADSYQQFVIQSILEVCPKAASIPNTQGQLPLHIALHSPSSSFFTNSVDGHLVQNEALFDTISDDDSSAALTWHQGGIRELTLAYTEALRQKDPISGLVPFVAAAAASSNTPQLPTMQLQSLSTIFELLVAAPEMVVTNPKISDECIWF